MDWHTSVYGARTGDAGGYGFHADDDENELAVAFGQRAIVSDARLRQRAGKSYYRAYEVVSGHRLHNLSAIDDGDQLTLRGQVRNVYEFAEDYEVWVKVGLQTRDITDSSCNCPAFGRYGAICKHVVALILCYNESSENFETDGVNGPAAGRGAGFAGGLGRLGQPVKQTSSTLRAFMRQEEDERRQQRRNRELELLKEVDNRAEAEHNGDGIMATRHMPIGSVSLRPSLEAGIHSWFLRLRITVPSRGVSYVVKDLAQLTQAVRRRSYVSYGKKLAFVHSADTFDPVSRSLLDIIDRAMEIRQSSDSYSGYRRTKAEKGAISLSQDEVSQILDHFVDASRTVDYLSPGQYSTQPVPVRVVDGDPDLGLAIEEDTEAAKEPARPGRPVQPGYYISHALTIEGLIAGRQSSFVLVRPSGGNLLDSTNNPIIHRCSQEFAAQGKLLSLLCKGDQERDLYLDGQDLEVFSKTILPTLVAMESAAEQSGQMVDKGNGTGDSADGSVGLAQRVKLPPELRAMKQDPCLIEIYLDRNRRGISCDLQARYGDRRFHVFDGIDPGDPVSRDRDTENLAMEAVRHYFPRPKDGHMAWLSEEDDKAIYKLLTEGLPVFRGLGQVFSTQGFDGLTVVSHPTVRLGLSVVSGLVEVSAIADEIDPKDVPDLLKSYRKKQRFHRLSSGAFVDLKQLDTSQVDELVADLGLKPDALETGSLQVPAYGAYYLDSQVDPAYKDRSFNSYVHDLRVVDPKCYQVPEALSTVLRPYQAEGFRWLNTICDKGFGGILADEMGLGKTVQLLSFLESRLPDSRKVGPSLIVCPASLVYNWQAECGKFVPDLRVGVVAGSKADRRSVLEGAKGQQSSAYDLLITSYDLLRRDIDDYRGLEVYCMALDEAQYIKNHATKSARAVRRVTSHHRFALTGTPIENRLSELWSIFDFLMPGMLGSYAHFRERFEQPILSGDPTAQSKLQAFVGPFILRRLKADVLKDLPEKIENVITVQLEGQQRRLYAALESQMRASLTKQRDIEFKMGKIQILAQLTKLRQVCCDPRLLYANAGERSEGFDREALFAGQPNRDQTPSANASAGVQPVAASLPPGELGEARLLEAGASDLLGGDQEGQGPLELGDVIGSAGAGDSGGGGRGQSGVSSKASGAKAGRSGSSAKLDAIEELVDSCRDAGRKMLIFSQFTSYLDLIAERLRGKGVAYDMITGATPKRKRLELVDRFNRDDTPVFLISLKAGNTGLNLTGACVVVHADPWWNAAAQEQANDRAHRIGQTQDVNVYQIVAKDTIEERILKLQQTKTDLAARFVDAASASGAVVASLSKDDLLSLLG
ncbi:DEAD/DEAH box helicase [Bifidobacterium aemilianum]|uniref:DEAD/DEAH box helicase n=1 Tax=Bifidobacterium aemilianum TaxID=2493120 RepID=UPI0013751F10|nr:SNF2-related protein [Bifidobacterium aemilianum]